MVLGGSISCGADTTRLDQEWTRRVFQFINNTWPHANHTFLNSCKPATPSMLIDACLDGYVPEKVDLVLMEVCCSASPAAVSFLRAHSLK